MLRKDERVAYDRTRLSLHDNGDGTVSGHFTVPDLHGRLLRTILETMTAPRRGRLGARQAQRVACGQTHATCAADGCERPLAWCELHHRRPWSARDRPTWPTPCRCAGSTIAGSTTPTLEHRYRPDGSVTFPRRP